MTLDATGIGAAYQQAFGREPNEGESQYWQNYQQQNGLDQDTLVHYLMKQTREPGGDQVRRDLITQAYQERLHRAPNDGEINWWSQQIMAHGPSDTSSDERAGQDEPFTYVKLVQYVEDQTAQEAAQSAPAQPQQQQEQQQAAQPAQPAQAAQPQQHPQQHQGFKWPWQK